MTARNFGDANTQKQLARLRGEIAIAMQACAACENEYASDHWDLMLAVGYLRKLAGNDRILRYLGRTHPDWLARIRTLLAG
jgi:hypothetical protein